MNYILFDPPDLDRFYPFTFTRPLGEMRIFGGTIKQHWEKIIGVEISYLTAPHLSDLYSVKWERDNILICSSCFPTSTNLQKYSIKSVKCELQEIQKKWTSLQKDNNLIYQNLVDFLPSIANNNSFFAQRSNIDCSKNPFLNDDDGPIVLEENVVIMELSLIHI